MEKISFYSVIFINLIIMTQYCIQTIRRKINPSLAMWLFFTIAVTGSLFSYLLEGNFTILDNILNSSDVILCGSVTLVIFFFGHASTRFNRFDVFCLGVVVLILIFWFFSRAHFATHLSLQLIQMIAYFPVVRKMLKASKNTESFLSWILILTVSILSLFTAKGLLAYIYSIRAIVCVSVLLLLMVRLEWKGRAVGAVHKSSL